MRHRSSSLDPGLANRRELGLVDRLEQGGALLSDLRQPRPADGEARVGQALVLAIQRQVVGEPVDQQAGNEAHVRPAAVDDVAGRRRAADGGTRCRTPASRKTAGAARSGWLLPAARRRLRQRWKLVSLIPSRAQNSATLKPLPSKRDSSARHSSAPRFTCNLSVVVSMRPLHSVVRGRLSLQDNKPREERRLVTGYRAPRRGSEHRGASGYAPRTSMARQRNQADASSGRPVASHRSK